MWLFHLKVKKEKENPRRSKWNPRTSQLKVLSETRDQSVLLLGTTKSHFLKTLRTTDYLKNL